jgi:nucleotide-binding universal stress UspA family protein
VLGMTTHHPFEAIAFDTVPYQLVRRSHCPVLLVPAEAQERQGAPVICGTDRSPASASALRWAAAEASRRGVAVRAVEILPKKSLRSAVPTDGGSLEAWVRDQLSESATTVSCSTETAHPSRRLLEITQECHGLLVIGAQEHTRWLQESVARTVTSQTHVPVVVVPAADAATAGQSDSHNVSSSAWKPGAP